MQIVDGELLVSPTDLTRFLACRHLTALDQAAALGERPPPPAPDEALDAVFRRGLEHERAYLARIRAQGRTVVEVGAAAGHGAAAVRAAEQATVEAMAAGADVVYQAAFFDGRWRGQADFLLRRDDRPGRWSWSYDVADTKLARRLTVPALLQMATYAERLTQLQGVPPERLVVVTGDAVERPYPFAECAAYARSVRGELLAFLAERPPTAPEPVEHCGRCRWQSACRGQWHAQDDLTLVAGIRRRWVTALRSHGIATVAALGATALDDVAAAVGPAVAARLHAQARLQLRARAGDPQPVEVLPAEPGRGLALLPEPSPGDVFFDIEGDPFAGAAGLEYLFGVVDAGGFTGYWALEPAAEQAAFERLVDHLTTAWARDPGMHVYHYALYEPTRLKALSGRYDTRGAQVDRLLRGNRFVDLYTVVKQGLRAGVESYSLKKLEPLYWPGARAGDEVSDALGSVVAFERWLLDRDDTILEGIRAYNEVDCRSTAALRDWLEGLRAQAGGDAVHPRPEHRDGAPSAAVAEQAEATAGLRDRLWSSVPVDARRRSPQEQATWLAGALLDWHRRESLPQWWDWYHRRERTDAELFADPAALAGLHDPRPVRTLRRSTVWRLRFEPQETTVEAGGSYQDPRAVTGGGVQVVAVDTDAGWIDVARRSTSGPPALTALVPGAPVSTDQQRARLHAFGRFVAEHGVDAPTTAWRAARDLLLRRPPRLVAGAAGPGGVLLAPGEAGPAGLARLAIALDGGVLAVQGPPGTGKTYAGARTVVDLVRAGLRVGICGFSHAVVGTLLDATVAAAREAGVPLRAVQKAGPHQGCASDEVVRVDAAARVETALARREADVVAGTAWLFAGEGMAGALDVLVVDEAGQLALADVLAVSHAARSLVLLGDPQQLTQPVRGVHPPGAAASALEHLLAGRPTVPADVGVLLDTTWRMHPGVAALVSDLSYEGRLRVAAGRERQCVDAAGRLRGAGVRWVPVPHTGNSAASREEVAVVRSLVAELLSAAAFTDDTGTARPMTPADVLVLAPYNQQVQQVRQALAALPGGAGVVVGTVDRMQGRQAAVVLYSLATSSVADAPRGSDFLLSRNRLTVALSRGRALTAVVASPALLLAPARGPADLRRIDALCVVAERAERVDADVGEECRRWARRYSAPPAACGAPGSAPLSPTASRAR